MRYFHEPSGLNILIVTVENFSRLEKKHYGVMSPEKSLSGLCFCGRSLKPKMLTFSSASARIIM